MQSLLLGEAKHKCDVKNASLTLVLQGSDEVQYLAFGRWILRVGGANARGAAGSTGAFADKFCCSLKERIEGEVYLFTDPHPSWKTVEDKEGGLLCLGSAQLTRDANILGIAVGQEGNKLPEDAPQPREGAAHSHLLLGEPVATWAQGDKVREPVRLAIVLVLPGDPAELAKGNDVVHFMVPARALRGSTPAAAIAVSLTS